MMYKVQSECERVQSLLSERQDGILSARRAFDVERHLASCRECTQVCRDLATVVELMHAASRRQPNNDFTLRLDERLQAIGDIRPPSFAVRISGWLHASMLSLRVHRFQTVGAAACALMLVALGAVRYNSALEMQTEPIMVEARAEISVPLAQHAAVAADDPFADSVADTLKSHVAAEHGRQ